MRPMDPQPHYGYIRASDNELSDVNSCETYRLRPLSYNLIYFIKNFEQ